MNTNTLSKRTVASALLALTSVAMQLPGQCTPEPVPGSIRGTDGEVHALAQWDPDGAGPLPLHVVFAGDFTAIGTVRADNIAMRNTLTGEWLTIGAGLQGQTVYALTVSPTGELFAGGLLTASGGVGLQNVARWNGNAWEPLGAGVAGGVYSMDFDANGDLLVGGNFVAAGGVAANRIARWDGAGWSALGAGVDGSYAYVHDIVVRPAGDIVVAGRFETAGGIAVENVARWSGGVWSSIAAGANGEARIVGLPNGDVLAWLSGWQVPQDMQIWDGATWTPLASDPYVSVRDMAVLANGDFVVGGHAYSDVVDVVSRWDGNAWVPFGTPEFDGGTVNALLATDAGLIVGGEFERIEELSALDIASWDSINGWRVLSDGFDYVISDLFVVDNGDLLAGGEFRSMGNDEMLGISRNDGTEWNAMGAGLGTVYTLTELPNGDILAGSSSSPAAPFSVWRWDGFAWQPVGSPPPGYPQSFSLMPNGELIAAGTFGVVSWDGTSWTQLTNGGYFCSEVFDGDLIVGSYAPNSIRRWDGVTWSSLGAGVDGSVFALQNLPNGDLVAAGSFSTAGGLPAAAIARWDGSWHALGNSPFGVVADVALLPDGSIAAVGRGPNLFDPPFVGIWDGSSWESLDVQFSTGTYPILTSIAVRDNGDIVVGGRFQLVDGEPSANFTTLAAPCPADVQVDGVGCAGANGQNELVAASIPWAGGTFVGRATGLPPIGLSVAVFGFGPLNVSLNTFLSEALPGCVLLTTPDLLATLPAGGVEADVLLPIPDDPALIGGSLREQVVSFDLFADEVTSSNALQFTIGGY